MLFRSQMDIVRRFFEDFSSKDTQIIIDPVMGDNGRTYRTYTAPMCRAMKELVTAGNIITPNVTEACILTDTPGSKAGMKGRSGPWPGS